VLKIVQASLLAVVTAVLHDTWQYGNASAVTTRPVRYPPSFISPRSCLVSSLGPTHSSDMLHARSAFVIGLDPGSKVSYFAVRVEAGAGISAWTGAASAASGPGSPVCTVLGFGSVVVDFQKSNPVLDVLTKPLEPCWESAELAEQRGAQTLYSLVQFGRRTASECVVIWERQRGYLQEHLGAGFVAQAVALGWAVRVMAPSDKYHRLGVSSNKQVLITGLLHLAYHRGHADGARALVKQSTALVRVEVQILN
jgi:hypothetical protein